MNFLIWLNYISFDSYVSFNNISWADNQKVIIELTENGIIGIELSSDFAMVLCWLKFEMKWKGTFSFHA